MAGIDSSIYFQQQAPDFLGSVQKGLSMRDMLDERKLKQKALAEEQSIKDAYKSAVVENPDGTKTFNGKLAASTLMGINPEKGVALNQSITAQEAAQQKLKADQAKEQIDFLGRTAGQVNAQNYPVFLEDAKKRGLPIEVMPPSWGPEAQQKLQYYQGMALTAKEKLDQQNVVTDNVRKDKELKIKESMAYTAAQKAKGENKAMSVAQAKQMGLYNSGVEAEKQFNAAIGKKGINSFDPTSNFQWIDKNDWAPNFLKSDESKEAHSAQDRWIESFLRDASGAAIPPSERGAYAKDFFPVAGDSAQVVKDKALARKLKMESAKLAATGKVSQASSGYADLSDDELFEQFKAAGGGK